MSKSLKLMMVAFCAVFMAGQANAGDQDANHLYGNKHVFQFIPSDSTGVRGDKRNFTANKMPGYSCGKNGNERRIQL